MDDELAAFNAEMSALVDTGASPAAAAAPKIIAAPPKVISAAPQMRSAAPPAAPPQAASDGRRLPPSEWATPQEIRSQLEREGQVVPQSTTSAVAASSTISSLPLPSQATQQPPPPQETAPFLPTNSFSGPKVGYVFKSGASGLGYYRESAASAMPPMPPAVSGGRDAGRPGGGGGGGGASSSAPAERNITRTVAGQVWKDKTLLEWPEDDFRVFVGDLGNEVNDDVLSHAFQRYASFQMARVVRDKASGKTKGYGFVSFKDPWDMTKALREMQGKYVGNRPIKLRKSTFQERAVTETHQPKTFEHALGVADKSTKRKFEKGGAMHKQPTWKESKKKKNLPW